MLLRAEQHDIWAWLWAEKALLEFADGIRISQQSGLVSRGNLIWFGLELDGLEQKK